MEVQAKLRFLRKSPRKVRLVLDVIRGLPVAQAETQLTFLNKESARPVLKLLKSAIANAEHNFKLAKADLYVKAVSANQGPTIKRFKPRAQGRATPIRKRTSHILIVLDSRTPKAKEKTNPTA
ncbi:MAG: 50S ribosomal protein L22 [bacterium]